ncbi:MAG: HAD family hydrolase [Candidatus Hodarchaeales archaeon]
MNKSAVIFDLDGVLIDSMGGFYQMVLEKLNHMGVQSTEEKLHLMGKKLLKDYQSPSKREFMPIFKLFWSIGTQAGLSKVKTFVFTLTCLLNAKKVYYSASLFSDAVENLNILKNSGFKLGICTLASKKQLNNTLEKFNIYRFFEEKALISRNEVKRLKPDPEGLLLALKALSSPPSKSYFLGDMPVDIIAGTKAGVKTIALTTGLLDGDSLKNYCNPTVITNSLHEACTWILKDSKEIEL